MNSETNSHSNSAQSRSVSDIMEAIRRAAGGDLPGKPDSPGSPDAAEGFSLPGFFETPPLDVSRRSYDVQELLRYRDRRFVVLAYQALLKREPDQGGLENYLQMIRGNPADKVRVLSALSNSAEGRFRNITVRGLKWEKLKLKLQRPPVVGKVMRLFFLLGDPRGVKRSFAMQEDRLGEMVEETGKALEWIEHRAQKRLDGKMDKHEWEKKADVWDLDAKADKRDLEKKADLGDMDGYLRVVGHVLDMLSEMRASADVSPNAQPDEEKLPQKVNGYSGRWIDELYAAFEEEFRGSRMAIQRKMEMYLPEVRDVIGQVSLPQTPPALPPGCAVLDLGCGRGEFLELLAKEGVCAVGVDENRLMVQQGKKRGLDVRQADIFDFLAGLPAECLAAVAAFHVIEHLPFERLLLLIDQVRRVLAPGGVILLETPNPCNILAGSVDFHRDPTHLRPIHPDTLLFLARARGFSRAGVFFMRQSKEAGLVLEDAAKTQFTELQDYVRVSRDYALLAYKA